MNHIQHKAKLREFERAKAFIDTCIKKTVGLQFEANSLFNTYTTPDKKPLFEFQSSQMLNGKIADARALFFYFNQSIENYIIARKIEFYGDSNNA